jgi:hypothetical protein
MLEDTLSEIDGEELSYIIPAVTKRHLREVICSKREELGLLCYLSTNMTMSGHIAFKEQGHV